MGETSKAYGRRLREGFFARYIQNLVIDLGCGDNPVSDECEKWDLSRGDDDATYLTGVPDNHFDTVYSFHLLEHLPNPLSALKNWMRVCKPGGWLIVGVPHRDLYEKKINLPSQFNQDHRHFWLPVHHEPPDTRGLLESCWEAFGTNYNLHSLRVLDYGCDNVNYPNVHANGEYTIELILKK